jgi:molybdopterin/thiamine biosynthesis adenylyltransferase
LILLKPKGAIGCEMIKNFALMGIACGGGQVVITVRIIYDVLL